MIDQNVSIESIDVNLIEFQTNKGTVDINPQAVAMVLDESKSTDLPRERRSCVIVLTNGFKAVVSHTRKETVNKLMRLSNERH